MVNTANENQLTVKQANALEKRIDQLDIKINSLTKALHHAVNEMEKARVIETENTTAAVIQVDRMWRWVTQFNSIITNSNNYMMNHAQEKELSDILRGNL